ncbi:hypothetical protein [Escherichia coli]|uniref:hypothetical protein n=1 Tax=Escherichia coli TaxID=562 RepID=UPI000DF29ACF|nr:hypothetical protein [Escherichia coli]EFH2757151.1 hypothetical protein [Escherichia coli]EHN4965639.1 hypothetical protein [Escherichia coli]MBN6245800.1 hypothetical protein [Escherichia coli]MCW9906749.1 hypothetical protein [Escherichia coli]
MSGDASTDSYEKVPVLSNVAAGAITGLLTLMIASWDGHFWHVQADLSAVKPYLLMALPGSAMGLAHGIKSIGFKWALGSFNRQLLSINKKKEKSLRKDIKKYSGVISNEKILDLSKQLEQVIQDKHDIIANSYQLKIQARDSTQEKYVTHQQTDAYDNPELKNLLDSQNQQ